MCFSIGWLENLIIFIIVICVVLALIQLVINFVLPKLGVGDEILSLVVRALTIIFWGVVCIAVVVFVFDLAACFWSMGGNILPRR